MPDLQELMEDFWKYFVAGGILVLLVVVGYLIFWGSFSSTNAVIQALSRSIGYIVIGVIALVIIGYLFYEFFWNRR